VEALEPRRTPTLTFAAQQTFAVGSGPEVVAAGDFNGDGRPDLAVANFNDQTVSVLLNATGPGAGTAAFAAQQTFAAGTNPIGVAVGDFNGDGRPDLAVVNLKSNNVSVLLNTTPAGSTTPTFAAQQTFAAGNSPFFVAVGDFNGDGRPDLAVTNQFDHTTSVLLNTTPAGTPLPTFAPQKTFAVGDTPRGVAAADVNGDGRPDLAVANQVDKTVSVLLNTTAAGSGAASFAAQQTFAVGDTPSGVAAGDVNGDGRPDLAVANLFSGVSVLLNTTAAGSGAASFAAQQTFAAGKDPRNVAVADLDGDGRPDLAVTNQGDTTVSVFLNATPAGSGSAAFAAQQTFAVGTTPVGVAAADFNGDGRPDLTVSNNGTMAIPGTTVSVLLNTTAPFASAVPMVVGQFGGQGVWQFNRALSTWVQLTPANASALADDPRGDVAASFKGFGVWLYRPATSWTQIGTGDAAALAMDSLGDVVGSFPRAGVWLFRPAVGFRQIGTGDTATLAMDPLGDVAGSFPHAGVWLYRPAVGFQQIGSGDASTLAMDALGDVVGSFPGAGVWLYQPAVGFHQIGSADATTLAMDALGDVVGSFRGHGVWLYRPAVGFRQIGPVDAVALGMDAVGEVFGSFAAAGVWEFDPLRGWTQRAASDAQLLAVG
jgi:hypothetical protein